MTATEAEFEKATDFAIKETDLERDRMALGVDWPSREVELFSRATDENIRNFAQSIGDDNPLFCDPRYGERTRWGGQVAPQIMAAVLNAPMRSDPLPRELRGGSFRGIHAFVSGGTWEWFRPLRPGDQLFSLRGLESMEEKTSEFAGRSVLRTLRDVKFNQFGEIIGVYRTLVIYTERKTARTKGKYADVPVPSYTDDDLARIEALYAAESRRGDAPRYWEDVEVGDVLGPKVKGPLTTTDIIVFHSGGFGFVPYGLRTSRLAHLNRQRIAPFFVKNEYGIPDVAQRVHWDNEWARAIGNPRAYDYGVLRECWVHHMLTDWAGDDAFILRQHDEIRRFNYQGDTTFVSGEVVGKRKDGDRLVVDVAFRAINQRDEETLRGEATIALPGRDAGAVILPAAPAELQVKALAAIAEHGLRGGQSRG
jgi:acyl dehydratase